MSDPAKVSKKTALTDAQYQAGVSLARLTELRVTATSPICAACSGTGKMPNRGGAACGACLGFGRTGARLPEDMPEGA